MSARRVKGEGSIYQRSSDGRWFYMIDLGWHGPPGNKKRDRRTVSAKTLKALQPKMKQLQSEVAAKLDGDGSMPLEKWLTYWLEEIAPETTSQRTRDTYKGYIDNWIVPHLGSKPLNRIKPADARALYKAMTEAGRAPATRVQVHAILQRALHVAENDRLILRSPMQSVSAPSGDKGSHGKLTTDEARRVMRVLANRPDRARWYAALLLGLRQGEALGLAWDDIDLTNNRINVAHSLGRIRGKGLELGKVKSQKSRRSLPLLAEVRAALQDTPRGTTGARSFTINPEIRKDFTRTPNDDDLVWGPQDNKHDYNLWQAILREAGVRVVDPDSYTLEESPTGQHRYRCTVCGGKGRWRPTKDEANTEGDNHNDHRHIPPRPLHAARAATASILSDLGVPTKIIQEILGHAQATTTEQHYIHGDELIHRTALEGIARELTQGDTT